MLESENKDEKLIECIRNRSIIYDSTHQLHKDRKAVYNAWCAISEELQLSGENWFLYLLILGVHIYLHC